MFTLRDALAYASSEKTKKGKKWEKEIQKVLADSDFLPQGELTGSIFKRTTFNFYVQGLSQPVHKKITDFYLPKFNHIVEAKDGLSDSTEQAIYFSVNSLISSKQFGTDFKFILLLDGQLNNRAMYRRLLEFAKNCSDNFQIYFGKDGLKEYRNSLVILDIMKTDLPMGTIEWYDFNTIEDNDKNRKIDEEHKYDLVDSILAATNNGDIRGLLRPFVGFRNKDGGINLVDAHHLKAACEIINKYTKYKIGKVPVYVLDHLKHLTEEEGTTIMSVINTLVLKWETFAFVELWEKTYKALGDSDRLYPYEMLRKSMEDIADYLGNGDNPNSAPILQAFCLSGRADESNWKQNTRNVHNGTLMFDEESYDNKLHPIVEATKKVADKIDDIRKVVGKEYEYRKEKISTPKKTNAILRAFATELSLQENERTNREEYYKSISELANGFWNTDTLLPNHTNFDNFENEDIRALYKFPTSGDEMKKYVRDEVIVEATKIVRRKK
jgi:hypothetical protein